MSKLTTERLEQYAHDKHMCNINDEIRDMARQLLAYEQAGKETKIYQYQSCLFNDENGETDWYWDDCDKGFFEQYDPAHRRIVYAAPVLPKQPEHSRQQFESLCNQFWNWAEFDEINHDEDPLLEWNGSNYTNRVTAALWKMYQAAPAQPVIPEHCQMTPDEMLCDFYEVSNWPDLVRELVKHVEQLQESAKRNVKPWEDTFPETLLPAYVDRITRANDACRAEMLKNGKSASTELPNHSELSTDSPVIPDGSAGTNCIWSTDSDGIWLGDCGVTWQFFDDGPDENGLKYCPSCGKKISVITAPAQESE